MYWPRSPLALLLPWFGQVFRNIEKPAEGAADSKGNTARPWSNGSAQLHPTNMVSNQGEETRERR
jgi:hypothetical protein